MSLTHRRPVIRTGPAPATPTEQAVTLATAVWITLGLFVDAYAHENIIDTATEDFFTPWHALFYSGFVASAAWFGVIAARRPQPGGRLIDRFPTGYRLGAVGVVVFAAGGVADGLWHTAFGIEVSIDALLSPTHLLLLVGGLLLLTAPLRAAWAAPDASPGWRGQVYAIIPMTLCTALVAFFFTYVWGLSDSAWIAVRYVPETQEGVAAVTFGVPASLLSTVVLVLPVVLLARRWRLALGATVFMWSVVAALEAMAFHGDRLGVAAALVGGLAVDLALHRPGLARAWQVRAAAFAGPVVLWSAWVWLADRARGVEMPIEIWSGLVLFAGLAGLALAFVGFPPPQPDEAHLPPAAS